MSEGIIIVTADVTVGRTTFWQVRRWHEDGTSQLVTSGRLKKSAGRTEITVAAGKLSTPKPKPQNDPLIRLHRR